MKKVLFTFFALASILFAGAQNKEIELVIRELEARENKAMLQRDLPMLRSIWSPTLMVNSPMNKITMSSQEIMDLINAGVIRYSLFTRNIEQILINGNMVITMGSEVVVPEGKVPKAGQTINRRYTNIWMKKKNKWQLVARHANEILPQ